VFAKAASTDFKKQKEEEDRKKKQQEEEKARKQREDAERRKKIEEDEQQRRREAELEAQRRREAEGKQAIRQSFRVPSFRSFCLQSKNEKELKRQLLPQLQASLMRLMLPLKKCFPKKVSLF